MTANSPSIAEQIGHAASAFEQIRTGHVPKSVTVVLNDDTLVVTLRGVLTRAERVLANTEEGAAWVREYHRRLLMSSSSSLLDEIKRITGVPARIGNRGSNRTDVRSWCRRARVRARNGDTAERMERRSQSDRILSIGARDVDGPMQPAWKLTAVCRLNGGTTVHATIRFVECALSVVVVDQAIGREAPPRKGLRKMVISTRKPPPLTIGPVRRRCAICGNPSYSQTGVHPQCSAKQAGDELRCAAKVPRTDDSKARSSAMVAKEMGAVTTDRW